MNIPQTIGGNYHSIIKSLQDKPERHVISTYLYLQSISLCHNDNQISFLSFYNFMNLPYELSLRLFKTLQSSKQKQEFISTNDFILGLSAIYSNTDINIKLNIVMTFLSLECNKTIEKKDIKIFLMLFHFIDNEENTFYKINEMLDLLFENDKEQLTIEEFKLKCNKDSSIPLLILFFLDHYQPFSNQTINFFIENIYNIDKSVQHIAKTQQKQKDYIITLYNKESSFKCSNHYLFQYLYYYFDFKNLIIDNGVDDLNTFERNVHEMRDKMLENKILNPVEQKTGQNLKSYFLDELILRQYSNLTSQFAQCKTITTDLSSQTNNVSKLRITKGVTINSSSHAESSGKNKTKKYIGVDLPKRGKSIITDSSSVEYNCTLKNNKTIMTDNNSMSLGDNKYKKNNTVISEGSIVLRYGNTTMSEKNPLSNEFEFFVILNKKNQSKQQTSINKNNINQSIISESTEEIFQFSKNKMYIIENDLYIFRYDNSLSKYFFKQIISLKQFYIEEGTEEEQIIDVENKTIYYSIHFISTLQNKIQINVIFVSDKSSVNRLILSIQRVTNFKTINDNYELINLLGKGSSGIVMKAVNKQTNFVVAVKIMEKDYKDMDQIVHIRREVDITKYVTKLNKSKLIKVIETIENYSTMYIIEEFSNGNNLEVFIKKKLPFLDNQLRNKLLISIIEQLLQSLAELKRIGVLHLDFKAENVLLNVSGVDDLCIKVIDFGTARIKLSTSHFFGSFGTLMYLAPEIIKKQEYTEKVDIWALGVLIYYLIHERPIFQLTDTKEIGNQILNSQIHIDKELELELFEFNKIQQLLHACLNRNPKFRANIEQLIRIFSGT